MKRRIGLVLLVMVVCMLCACGKVDETETLEQTRPTATAQDTAAEPEVSVNGDVVVDALHDVAICRGIYGDTGKANHFRIPKVVISGEEAEKTNQVIFDELYSNVYEKNMDQAEQGIPAGLNYAWTEHRGIISVLVCWQHGDLMGHANDYYKAYNIQKESGQLLSSAGMAIAFGLTEEELLELAKEAVAKEYDRLNGHMLENPDCVEEYWVNLEKLLSEENTEWIMPFISEEGDLCVVTRMHGITTGEWYETLLNLTGNTTVKDPGLLWNLPEEKIGLLAEYHVYEQGKK